MSLKAFHIIFVTISTLFSVFFGVWSLDQYLHVEANALNLVYMVGSLALVVGLPIYGYYFLKKLKHVSYL